MGGRVKLRNRREAKANERRIQWPRLRECVRRSRSKPPSGKPRTSCEATEAAEYKHVVSVWFFSSTPCDAFTTRRLTLEQVARSGIERVHPESRTPQADPEPDDSTPARTCLAPEPTRWEQLQLKAKQPEIGQLIDVTYRARESSLKGVLPKNYGRADLDKRLLGELVDSDRLH